MVCACTKVQGPLLCLNEGFDVIVQDIFSLSWTGNKGPVHPVSDCVHSSQELDMDSNNVETGLANFGILEDLLSLIRTYDAGTDVEATRNESAR